MEKTVEAAKQRKVRVKSDKKTLRGNALKLTVLAIIVVVCILLYLLLGLNYEKMKFIKYSLDIRIIQSTLVMVMDPNEYETLLTTLVASFSNINSEIMIFSAVLLVVIVAVLWRDIRVLDVMTLGKAQAINLGVDYDRSVRRLLLGTTLYIAVATAMVGPLSFLGLIVANLAREFLRTFRHTQLILASTLFGMLVLIGGQVIVERAFDRFD